MTILNAHVTADRVLLCTDTAVVSPDRSSRAELSKIFYLPHANIAMAGRGVQELTLGLFQGAWMNRIANLDQLEDLWTNAALDGFFAQLQAMMKEQGHSTGSAAGGELLMAGWSHRRGRMTALHYVKNAGEQYAKAVRDTGLIAPDCKLTARPAMDSIAAMAELARRQIAHWTARAPDEGFGGRLAFADLQRYGASFTTHDI